jgi:glycine/D-amino acid oxidase-like deaminating enzyme
VARKTDRKITGGFVNDSFPLGHRLRDRAAFRAPAQQLRVPIVIVGGGMAGLNAAWHLDKRGFRDFVLLEMERQAGGNSRWGENEISRFPWAAHYVPVPAKGESLARELFEELGVLRDGKWDERALCFDPQERLFINGHWQEGIEPEDGATPKDRAQYRRFMEKIGEFRATGQFTVPMERGASRRRWIDVDGRLAGAAGLRFGASALVHQLRLPRRLRRAGERHVGVGWDSILRVARAGGKRSADVARRQRLDRARLIEKLRRYLRTGGVVYRVARERQQNPRFDRTTEYIADAVIWAAPTFLASYM